MSHEGIRFVSEEQAAREAAAAPVTLPKDAITPKKVRVDKTAGTGMEIEWMDGHRSAWNFTWLRDACPCATCHEDRDASGRKPGEAKPSKETNALLPMYKAPIRPETVTQVGRYAVNFKWNDGHESGIYSWDYLRRHCLCSECRTGDPQAK